MCTWSKYTYEYQVVCLCKDGVKKYVYMHHLVGHEYMDNPNNNNDIDLVDHNKHI